MEMLIMKSETELESFIRNTAAAAASHSTTLWGPPYDDDDDAPPGSVDLVVHQLS